MLTKTATATAPAPAPAPEPVATVVAELPVKPLVGDTCWLWRQVRGWRGVTFMQPLPMVVTRNNHPEGWLSGLVAGDDEWFVVRDVPPANGSPEDGKWTVRDPNLIPPHPSDE